MILVTGALLAAALAASLLAGRLRVPGLVLVPRPRHGRSARTASGWIHFDDYELARDDRHRRAGADPVRGRPRGRLRRDPARAAAGAPLAIVGTILTAVDHRARRRVAVRLLDARGRCCSARSSPRTDGAAIFAVLRGSTLKRRLARTLEGEAGLNDPVAVLLVLGFIDWIQQPDYGIADMAAAVRPGAGDRRGRSAPPSGWPASRACSACGSARPASTRSRRSPPPRSPTALADVAARLRLPGRLPARPRAGQRDDPGHGARSSTFHEGLAWVAQLGDVPHARPARLPVQLGDVALEGTVLALVAAARRAAAGRRRRRCRSAASRSRERLVLGWAGLRGAVPVVLATFPVIDGVAAQPTSSSTSSSSRSCCQHRAPGRDVRAVRAARSAPRPTSRRCRRRCSEPGAVRRLGAEVVEFAVGPGDAVVGQPRARPRAAARRAAEPDRPRRAGDPAARLDA